jgi:hypothetical protein
MSLRIAQLQEVRTAPAAHGGRRWPEGPVRGGGCPCPSLGIALGMPWTRGGHTEAALCQRLSRIVIDGRRRAIASGASPHPANIPPFAYMAICEPLRGVFSFGLVAVPQDRLDGREGLGWKKLRMARRAASRARSACLQPASCSRSPNHLASMQTPYRDPASEWRSARERHGQNNGIPYRSFN